MNNENPTNQLQIELSDDVAQGIYANLAVITHSSSEFIVDFIRVMPGLPKAGVKSRIILTPEHAKRLMRALEDNVRKYENSFGSIHLNEENSNVSIPGFTGEA
jgi:predicted transcriptional regulator